MASKKNGNNHQYARSARLGKKICPEFGLEIDLDELRRLYGERGCRVKLSIMDDGDIRRDDRRRGRRGVALPAVPPKKTEYSFQVPPRRSAVQRTGRTS